MLTFMEFHKSFMEFHKSFMEFHKSFMEFHKSFMEPINAYFRALWLAIKAVVSNSKQSVMMLKTTQLSGQALKSFILMI